MEKKQTAVEWLAERCGVQALEDVIAEAKRMEREQIINAFSEGTRMIDINDELSSRFNACLYYVQTYGGQDEK